MEEWRDIPSAPFYQASSLGRIRRSRSATGTKAGRVRRLHVRASGYVDINLSHGNVHQNRTVHSLVCEAFHGPAPSSEHEVSHGNGDRSDNRPENLSWKTHLENEAEKVTHGTIPVGQDHYNSKISEEMVREIRLRFSNGERPAPIARNLSLKIKHVCKIISRQIWTHI